MSGNNRTHDRRELACLRITPSCGSQPLPTYKLMLVSQGDNGWIEATQQVGRKRESWKVTVSLDEVNRQLDTLRNASLPAFPVSPMVCDGEYVELTIHGEFSNLTLGWWTMAPDGSDRLAEFADWLRGLAMPDEDEQDDD